jgi:cellulose synthase/poly-beta-1,6-N-acetylglucosamine synthase-like glycosyltransferase
MLAAIALAVLCAATLLALYILAGYPLLLAKFPFRQAPPVSKDPTFEPTVCALIAVHNGEEFLRAKLDSLLAMDYPPEKFRILVVSDGSTDGTAAIARAFTPRVSLIQLPKGGKADALTAGLEQISEEVVLFTDVRQPFHRDALRHLAANLADPSVGAVTGELAYRDEAGSGVEGTLDLYWRYELWARGRHSAIDSLFNATGAIYAAKRRLISPIPADTLADDAVIPLGIFLQGYRVVFESAAVAWDRRALAKAEFGRKVRTLGGVWQAFARLPELFTPRNRMRLHFLSHKFGRLILPWALLAIVLATLALPPGGLRTTLIWNELALAAAAVAAPIVPKRLRIKRVFSAARAFLSMNLAAAASVRVLFGGARKVWAAPTSTVETVEKH